MREQDFAPDVWNRLSPSTQQEIRNSHGRIEYYPNGKPIEHYSPGEVSWDINRIYQYRGAYVSTDNTYDLPLSQAAEADIQKCKEKAEKNRIKAQIQLEEENAKHQVQREEEALRMEKYLEQSKALAKQMAIGEKVRSDFLRFERMNKLLQEGKKERETWKELEKLDVNPEESLEKEKIPLQRRIIDGILHGLSIFAISRKKPIPSKSLIVINSNNNQPSNQNPDFETAKSILEKKLHL